MVADSDWPLESLQRERGARMVYRVSRQDNTVRLEGREGSRTCLFETTRPERVSRHLPAGPATQPPLWLLRRNLLPPTVCQTAPGATL